MYAAIDVYLKNKSALVVVVYLCAPRTHPLNFTFIPMRKLVANYARASGKHPSHEMRPRYANRRCQYCTDITYLSPTHRQHPHCNLRASDLACSQPCYNQVSSWMSLLSTLVNLCLAHYSSERSRS